MKTIELSLSPAYCSNWTAAMALREFIANAMDSGDSHWTITQANSTIVITNKGTLPLSSLLMGSSAKPSSDAIGQFGEGFKVGIAVLISKGATIRIQNNNTNWDFSVVHSDTFEAAVLQVQMYDLPYPSDNITVIIHCPPELYQELYYATQSLMPPLVPIMRLGDVGILETKGIFVSGLQVCEPNFFFGYNFHPRAIALNRDRTHFDTDAASKIICQSIEDNASHMQLQVLANPIYNILEEGAYDDFRYLTWYPDDFPRIRGALMEIIATKSEGKTLTDHRTAQLGRSGYYLSYGLSAIARGGAYGSQNAHLFAEINQEPWLNDLEAILAKHRNSLRRDTRQDLEKLLSKYRKTR